MTEKICIFTLFYHETRKTTGFKCLRTNCWEINQVTSKCQVDFWDKTFKKGLKQKKKNHHRILHIRNSLGAKFKLKLAISNFWTKLTRKRYFQSKKE